MPEPLPQRSPLAEFLESSRRFTHPLKTGVEFCERPMLGYLNLRGVSGDPRFFDAVERQVGISIPLRPNTFTKNDDITTLWLGPNEWLIITSPGRAAEVARKLREALPRIFSAVTDVSHNQTVIRIQGDRARDVLRKGCTLDLHPAAFGPGCCAQTLLAKAGVVIRWVDHSPAFDLVVRRSFADYLALWLKDAAEEYGVGWASST